LIYRVLNRCYRITKWIGGKHRDYFRIGLYFTLFLAALLYGASVLPNVHLLVKCIVGAGLMGLIIVFTMKEELHVVKWNKKITVLWLALGIVQLFSGLFVSREYLPMAVIWIVLFPMLFLVWNNRKDYERLFCEVAIAGDICFVILAGISVCGYSFNVLNYGGFLKNPNGLGQWITFAYPLILFLYSKQKKNIWKVCFMVQAALALVLCIASRSRTALLAVLFMSVLFVIYRVWNMSRVAQFYKSFFCFVLCFVLVACACLIINTFVLEEQAMQSGLNDSFLTRLTANTRRFIFGWSERFAGADKADTSINSYSSGRIGIWKKTIESLNWKGHPSREHIIVDRNGNVGNNTHNMILQFAYDNGIVAGIIYVLLIACSGFKSLKKAKENIHDERSVYPYVLIIHAGYGVTCMLASINLPFLYMISFLYYLSFAVLIPEK